MAICIECEYYVQDWCRNPDLPIDNWVLGIRDCYELNHKGDCKGFEAKLNKESIYELPTDEELAKT